MQKEFKNLLKVLISLIIVLLFFSIIRVYFYFSNQNIFTGNLNLPEAFLYGLCYDFLFVLWINGAVLFLFFFPFRIRNTIFWQGIVKILFVLINFSALLFSLLSAKFYSVLSKQFLALSESDDFISSVFRSLSKLKYSFYNVWDIVLFSAFAFIVLWQIFPSINNMLFERTKSNKITRYTLSFLGILIFLFGIYEHKYQTKRWQTSVFRYINRPTALLSINNSYKLLHLYLAEKEKIQKNNNSVQNGNLFSIHQVYKSAFENKVNPIIINIRLHKPADDELMHELSVSGYNIHLCKNFYVKRTLEIQHCDELLLSFPGFINKALYQSKFAFNSFQSIADILREHNYYNIWVSNQVGNRKMYAEKNFYGFDDLIAHEDFDKLMLELNETLQHINRNYFIFMNFEGAFSGIEDFLTNKYFQENSLIIVNIIPSGKRDYGFAKTLILVPENNSQPIYIQDTITNLDVFPGIIDYLGINAKFTSFGQSIFKKQSKELFQYTGKEYILLKDSLLLRYNGISTKWLVNYKKDPDEYYDVQDNYPVQKIQMENKIRAIIHEYKNSLY